MKTTLLVTMLLFVGAGLTWPKLHQPAVNPPPAVNVRSSWTTLSFIGLPTDRLLAAGLSVNQVTEAAQRLHDASAQVDALSSALAQRSSRQSELTAAHDSDQEPDGAAVTATETAIQSLNQQIEQLRSSLKSIVLADSSEAQRARLSQSLRGIKYGVSAPLALAADSDATARRLASAVRSEARSARTGDSLSDGHQQLLSNVRARSDVVEATGILATSLPALRSALSQPAQSDQP